MFAHPRIFIKRARIIVYRSGSYSICSSLDIYQNSCYARKIDREGNHNRVSWCVPALCGVIMPNRQTGFSPEGISLLNLCPVRHIPKTITNVNNVRIVASGTTRLVFCAKSAWPMERAGSQRRSGLETPISHRASTTRTPRQGTHLSPEGPSHRHQGEAYPCEVPGGEGQGGHGMGSAPRDTAGGANDPQPIQGNSWMLLGLL